MNTAAPGEVPPPLALTMGEPAGIGGEIALAAWAGRVDDTPPFFLLDDPTRLARLATTLDWSVPVEAIANPAETAAVWPRALPVLPLAVRVEATPGAPDPANAAAVVGAIRRGVSLVRGGEAAALVTNPIHKRTLYGSGFRFPGHTEFLAELTGTVAAPVMMLAVPGLRVVPVTIHLPLLQAIGRLDRAAIVHCGRVTAAALQRDFAIARPRIAVAGLNPHAGEGGSLGREETDIIAPAVAELAGLDIDTTGPLPADTLFHPEARARWDAVICMYHDQALIPLKTIDFAHGVNITLGLPIVRTSPDHGTAFDIAGRGSADPASLVAALRLAATMAARRRASLATAA